MNLNGGNFNEIGVFKEEPYQIWQIKNDACHLTSCAERYDPKNHTYSKDVYLTPTGNLAGTYLSTLKVADKFQWWMYTFWDTCDSTDGSHCWDADESQPVRNQVMLFIFDYKDPDNWTGVRIEYKPDFNISPGQVGQIFEASGRQNVAGTESMLTETLTFNFGTGNTKAEIGIEINCDQRTECGSDPFVNIFFGDFEIGFNYTSVGGDRIACSQVTPSGVVDTIYCDEQEYRINEGFGIYNWVIEYLESQKEGCAEYGYCCSCYTPSELNITFSGFSDDDCSLCEDAFDQTYSATWVGASQGSDCNWIYYFDPYNRPECTKDDIKLTLIDIWVRRYTGQKWVVELNVNILDTVFMDFQECTFIWEYDEGIPLPSLCNLDGTETFTRLVAPTDYTAGACSDFGNGWLNLSNFCSTMGTVTIENG